MNDVAALVEWLQTWSPVTANGQRAHLAASELTRLAAENRTYAEAHAFNTERFAEMLSERDAAKAEIARLRGAAIEKHRDMCEVENTLKAEIARLTRTLIWIAHTYTEDSHGNMKTLPAADYQKAAKDALKPDTGEKP